MNFDFDQAQYQFGESVGQFLAANYPLDRLKTNFGGDTSDEAQWRGLGELGLFSALVAGEYGGLDLSLVDLALAAEEIGKSLAPISIGETFAATDLIQRFGTAAQKEKFLPRIAAGELRACLAVLEADCGFDLQAMHTSVKIARSEYQLSGTKILSPHAVTADLIVIPVRFAGTADLGIALIEPKRHPVLREPHHSIDPSCALHSIKLDGVSLGSDSILGGGPSSAAASRLFDLGAAISSGMLVGIAEQTLQIAINYARDRVQFGKPIGSYQAIKHKCADLAIKIEAARAAAYYAFWALAEDAPDRARACSIAKAYSGDTARSACNECVQIHGGMGFTWDLGIHYFLRRTKVLEYAFGDATFHRERVVAETLADLRAGAE